MRNERKIEFSAENFIPKDYKTVLQTYNVKLDLDEK
jgi:hypothetical protein